MVRAPILSLLLVTSGCSFDLSRSTTDGPRAERAWSDGRDAPAGDSPGRDAPGDAPRDAAGSEPGDGPKAELKKGDGPRTDAARDAARVDLTKADKPKLDLPPKTDKPKLDLPPKADKPKLDVPKLDKPSADVLPVCGWGTCAINSGGWSCVQGTNNWSCGSGGICEDCASQAKECDPSQRVCIPCTGCVPAGTNTCVPYDGTNVPNCGVGGVACKNCNLTGPYPAWCNRDAGGICVPQP